LLCTTILKLVTLEGEPYAEAISFFQVWF